MKLKFNLGRILERCHELQPTITTAQGVVNFLAIQLSIHKGVPVAPYLIKNWINGKYIPTTPYVMLLAKILELEHKDIVVEIPDDSDDVFKLNKLPTLKRQVKPIDEKPGEETA